MQYFVSVIATGTESAKPGEDAAIDAFNERLRTQGYWVYANGLAEPSTARAAYDKAIELTANTAELAYLIRQRNQLGQ